MPKGKLFRKINSLGAKTEESENRPNTASSFVKTMTLHNLQDKMKRQPEMYRKEMEEHLQIFKDKMGVLKENPGKKSDEIDEYLKFMAHISGVYKSELADFLCNEFINLL